MKVLIVDDDLDILNIVRTACENESMQTSTAANAEELWSSLRSEKPDVILLDIMLPDANGLDLVKKIRTMYSRIPIIFLTARKSDLDMILGLELGADDYVTKPFNPRALVARIKAVMRRTEISGTLEDKLTIGDAVVNLKSYTVTKNGKSEELTRREFELLKLLAENPGRVFTREELLDKVWGMDFFGDFRTVDVHISKLREKVGEGFIKTVRGVGYKFVIGEQR
ncbi:MULTISPECIES: response regulator transcription factor [Mesotoga]|uniref:Response regulator with CheY-like receiver domain and winged-helix DNA-binding domain n=1 Tax=Mesotoga prima MesG1.Ag.4.2 TaxID=660470 RepID=I2F6U2_9BACT|nr:MULTISPECIES: response regulator transcription factor [Mesotoga]MCP5457570.1 response regulator transcription factor [Thermotogota bacterium]CCU84460.1 Transcriptional regulatory protein walR [Mesotoga infera]AFK07645.1 response regulator with CheY-like receiver domain and winged-helix DNA-binding domain [Mesotoga prima MesG1.Ag.4.2]MCB1223145.1 response regulator transcription factor [Mesotoga sp.]MCP5461254.1 response regulator transcription factor [Thermotogota bacterium]